MPYNPLNAVLILTTSMPDSKISKLLPPKKYAALPIDFLVVGGGVSGLASAIALTRVGHRVTVLERDATVDHVSSALVLSRLQELTGSLGNRRMPYDAQHVKDSVPLGIGKGRQGVWC